MFLLKSILQKNRSKSKKNDKFYE